ncbi:mRNA-capping enzyme subunit beta [Purpureocillium takamizusanense]|uniref:mRNA-capping enzyme subunit beta n=1 Tax=Purpureocillium takamizusanense TaxID=2060973 RepID=A0A9Q8VGS3_9HYPO|nr:mRNA-capping enzyme subunit beta [Purpureocillium takamizusanense]UNI24906.1 mRNA-capping enzyme subunit beta [Purpureocillium takamizusanense]
MDLRSVLNTSDNGDRGPPKAPLTPQQQKQPPPQPLSQPHPAQSPAQYGAYREYAQQQPQQQQPPPSQQQQQQQHMSQDYPHHPHQPQQPHQQQQHPHGAYPQPQYQNALQHHAARDAPPPPPLRPAGSFHDVRSPGGAAHVPPQSPYRPTPTPTNAPAGAAGYPFPPQATPEMPSPSQRHQYPPTPYQQQQQQPPSQHQRRDSYSQAGVAGHAYVQPQQVPQTPPIGTSGASSHVYMHQRSQSTHSTPTPTSAHSQQHFGPPHVHGSPVVASQPHPADFNRQPSQPPTPIGPPPPVARQSTGFAQPPSPYQQRMSSVGQPQASPTSHPPPPLPPHAAQRMPSSSSTTHAAYESPAHDSPHSRPISRHGPERESSLRESSLSVSPRTRVASLASSSDRDRQPPSAGHEPEKRPTQTFQPMAVDTAAAIAATAADRAVTPAKRKLEDRSMSPRELENRQIRPPPGEVNGRVQKAPTPEPTKKRRQVRARPPIWAQSAHTLGNRPPAHPNFVLQKRPNLHVNGKQETKPERPSRQPSPEAQRAQQGSVAANPPPPPVEAGPQDILGPWEASITGIKPYEEVSKKIADFIFINAVNNRDIKEIVSRGIHFEIEAKLGTLIDKDTNHRVERYLETETVLQDTGRVAFRSSMTEAHHKAFNEFLNQMVIQTDPRAGTNRVQVHYKHRREIDRYFELPPDLQNRLPGCVRSRLGARARNVRVRVTYDQRTREVLDKIIKARVADIDLHMPSCPMDCRLSINLEMPWEGSVEELERLAASPVDRQPDRNKDRLSYSQGHYQVDLTQVTVTTPGPGNAQRTEKEHELEIEVSPEIVLDQGNRAMNGAPHRYQELVEGLVDNVRLLARKAREFG